MEVRSGTLERPLFVDAWLTYPLVWTTAIQERLILLLYNGLTCNSLVEACITSECR
jgi:hypothetical protein